MTKEELEMRTLVRESDVIDRTDGSELAKAFNYLWEKYVEQESCEDCISRKAVLDINESHHGQMPNHINHQIWEEINDLPSVTSKPKTGHWILDETDNSITCDKCGCLIWANDIHNGEAYYCPNCGAKMVEPQESDLGDYPDLIHNQFDNMTGSMNL